MAHTQTAKKMLMELIQWRAKKEPLLTERLLACAEDQFYETHTQPQQALLALSGLFSSYSQAIFDAQRAGASADCFMHVDPEHFSALMATLARSMQVSTCTVDYAANIRAMHKQIADENHENAH